MGNARGGALGDCLAAVLDWAGYDVSREFYVNDAGNQIDKFGLSLDIRYQQILKGEDFIELPEDSYHGDDIRVLAQSYIDEFGTGLLELSENDRRKALVEFALPKNIATMKAAMAKYRIDYNTWFSELTLHNGGELQETIDILKKNGYTYEKEGALWYKNIEVMTAILKREGKSDEDIEKLELNVRILTPQEYALYRPALWGYVVYTTVGEKIEPWYSVAGVWQNGNYYAFEETDFDYENIAIDSSMVDYDTPGVYEIIYYLNSPDQKNYSTGEMIQYVVVRDE
jgi:hypothetical protein